MGNYLLEGHVPFQSIKKLNLKSPTIAGIAVPGMPHGSPGMEVHNNGSHSHNHYKSYEVYSFGENIEEEIFDKAFPWYSYKKELISPFLDLLLINKRFG